MRNKIAKKILNIGIFVKSNYLRVYNKLFDLIGFEQEFLYTNIANSNIDLKINNH